jgi:tetratricopeptide (TPR) repeat protein
MSIEYIEQPSRELGDLFNRGTLAMESGNLDYAIEIFASCIEREPLFLKARRHLRMVEVEKFNEAGGSAMTHKISGAKGMAQLMVGIGQLKMKQPEKAILTAEKLLRMDPLNSKFAFLLTDAAIAAGTAELAVQTMELLRDHTPDVPDVLRRLGQVYEAANRSREATRTYERLCALLPGDLEARRLLKNASAVDTMAGGGWEEMVRDGKTFRDVIADKDEAASLDNESKAIQDTGEIDAIIEETLAKIEKEPANLNFRRLLARLYRDNGHYKEALQALEEALKIAVGDPQVENMMVDTYLMIYDDNISELLSEGKTDEAATVQAEKEQYHLDSLYSRTESYPNDLDMKYQLGKALYDGGDFAGALPSFQQSQRHPKRRVDSVFHIGMCFAGKGQHDLAREQFERAISEIPVMDKAKMEIVYELALACEALSDHDAALNHFKAIYQIDIGFRDVAERMDRAYSTGG